jgi:hypothetical protein
MSTATKVYDVYLTPGQSKILMVTGKFYRVQTATGAISVTRDDGSTIGPLLPGQGETGENFTRIIVTNTSGYNNTVTLMIGDSNFIDNRLIGSVTVLNTGGSYIQASAVVTSISSKIIDSNADRRYLLIQNNDANGDIYLMLNGQEASLLGGLKVAAGASFELNNFVTNQAIFAIGSIALNGNITILEG